MSDGHNLYNCPGYSPSIQHMGDCRHCGHTFQDHEDKEALRQQNPLADYISRRDWTELMRFKDQLVMLAEQGDATALQLYKVVHSEMQQRAIRSRDFLLRIDQG